MAAPGNRPPHLGVLAATTEIATFAEVTNERARQLTKSHWWTVAPMDFIGGRFVYEYPATCALLTSHHYPRRLYPDHPKRVMRRNPPEFAAPERIHRGVLAGIKEIAQAACVPTSRADQITKESWFWPQPIDHLAGGTVFSYPDVMACLTERGYPRIHKTIGERMEAASRTT